MLALSACNPITTTGAGVSTTGDSVSSTFDATSDTSKSSSGEKATEKSWIYEESAS